MKSGSVETSTEWEANESLAIFFSLLFTHPVLGVDGKLIYLAPVVFTDEVKQAVGTVTKSTEQVRTMAENMKLFAEDVSQERGYLSRAARFPFLSQTLVTYLRHAHVHSGIIDGNNYPIRMFLLFYPFSHPTTPIVTSTQVSST